MSKQEQAERLIEAGCPVQWAGQLARVLDGNRFAVSVLIGRRDWTVKPVLEPNQRNESDGSMISRPELISETVERLVVWSRKEAALVGEL